MGYETIASPVNLGGLVLKNRIIFAPTSFGLPEERLLEKLRRIAAGGCAMIIVGDVPAGRSPFGSLYSARGFARYRRLCEAVHREGCLICAQLHQSDSDLAGMVRYLPGVLTKRYSMDQLRELLNQRVGPYISSLPTEKVAGITASFGSAAVLAGKAGFDMVQVHGDRMCGSFASPLFNRRQDRYGASVANRARFAVEAVTSIRRSLPDMPIDFKLAVRQEEPHYGNAGVLVEELPVLIPLLEQAGATSFHVALADHSRLSDTIPPANHPYFSGQGCFLRYADKVRSLTHLPVCGVGGLTDPDFVEEQLKSGRIDCAAMSRQLLADPDWPRKVTEGNTGAVRQCVRCNRDCLGGIQRHEGVHCVFDREQV